MNPSEVSPATISASRVDAPCETVAEPAGSETTTFLSQAALLIEPGQVNFPGARVLVVDDEEGVHRLLDHMLRPEGLHLLHAYNSNDAIKLIENNQPDLIISDVMMPGMNGIQLCKRLKTDPHTALLPILLMTAFYEMQDRADGFEAGADEFISKPFRRRELLARVRCMLRMKFLHDQLENAEQVIFSLARAVEAKDAYTGEHIERVSSLAVLIGKELGADEATCAQLLRGGILHDIGKIAVPDIILNKPGRLTEEEFAQMRRHPEVGERICRSLKTLHPVLDMIRHHHERLDGSGYPDGIKGNELLLPARIMAVCDVYDALTSTRAYRDAMSREDALEILDAGVSALHWDGDVVRALKGVA